MRDDTGPQRPPGYRVQATDTTYPIEQMLVAAWRVMSTADKARQLVECCRAVDQLALAGLRLRHPDADDAELRRRVASLRLGAELACEVYGPEPTAPRDR
jgi:hypothetical protein